MRLCTKRTVGGQRLDEASASMPDDASTADDLGLGGDGQQRRGGCTGAATRVEQP